MTESQWALGTTSLPDYEPCPHAGCLSHLSHPCEGCGRIGGMTVPLINDFRGVNRWLSNFHLNKVRLNFPLAVIPGDDSVYDSNEHGYQASKFLSLQRRIPFTYDITPAQARRMGQAPGLRKDWETVGESGILVKGEVMREVLIQKYSEGPLKSMLIDTFPSVLIEGNFWHDRYFGVCNGKCKSGPHPPTGFNVLGRLTMEVRYLMMKRS